MLLRACSQQLLYRYLAANPELDDAVLAAVGDDVGTYVERIVGARQFGQVRQAANPGNNPPAATPSGMDDRRTVAGRRAARPLSRGRSGHRDRVVLARGNSHAGDADGADHRHILSGCCRPDAVPSEHVGPLLHR